MAPYTSKYSPLGHTTSSRVDGAHAKTESYIEVSTENLLADFVKLRDFHITEMNETCAEIGKQ